MKMAKPMSAKIVSTVTAAMAALDLWWDVLGFEGEAKELPESAAVPEPTIRVVVGSPDKETPVMLCPLDALPLVGLEGVVEVPEAAATTAATVSEEEDGWAGGVLLLVPVSLEGGELLLFSLPPGLSPLGGEVAGLFPGFPLVVACVGGGGGVEIGGGSSPGRCDEMNGGKASGNFGPSPSPPWCLKGKKPRRR
jgi:hypothetical protein